MAGKSTLGKGLGYGVDVTIKKYFSSIVAISFTGGGNRSTWRKTEKYYIHLDQYRLSVTLLKASDSEWVSDCCSTPTQQFFSYYGEYKFI